jgi:opacity protein-like surface antigen
MKKLILCAALLLGLSANSFATYIQTTVNTYVNSGGWYENYLGGYQYVSYEGNHLFCNGIGPENCIAPPNWSIFKTTVIRDMQDKAILELNKSNNEGSLTNTYYNTDTNETLNLKVDWNILASGEAQVIVSTWVSEPSVND